MSEYEATLTISIEERAYLEQLLVDGIKKARQDQKYWTGRDSGAKRLAAEEEQHLERILAGVKELGTKNGPQWRKASAKQAGSCKTCGKEIAAAPGAGRPAEYCSGACRVKAHREKKALTPGGAWAEIDRARAAGEEI